VTIRLTDLDAQKRFEREVETYEKEAAARQNAMSAEPWPSYPKAPEPLVDSRDKGLGNPNTYFNSVGPAYPGSSFSVVGRDLCMPAPLDFDGTSQSEVEGHESSWQAVNADGTRATMNHAPFDTKE